MNSDNPILNSPYEEPEWHYATDSDGSLNYNDVRDGRRIFTPDINAIPTRQEPHGSVFEANDYDGSNFLVKQVFFCEGEKKEFDKWRKRLENIARQSVKHKTEKTLKVEIDDDAFDRLYGFRSHPIAVKHPNQ